jgi:hypothetical protein
MESGTGLRVTAPDPSKSTGDETEQLTTFQQVRDAIKAHVEVFVEPEIEVVGRAR